MFTQEKKWFLSQLNNQDLVEKLKKIKLVIADIDGALTDNTISLDENNGQQKSFSIQDGYAITKAPKVGVHVAFLSGKHNNSTLSRAKGLGIPKELFQMGDSKCKIHYVHNMQAFAKATKEETIHFGDDVLDLYVKPEVGLFASPNNALFYVKHNADIIVPRNGGHGAFRMLLDLILYAQGSHFAQSYIKDALQ
jgi:3-deoxy-D-manno-octulosonate 8-phosphate phosphatase (KDO 8-P phosphatase)